MKKIIAVIGSSTHSDSTIVSRMAALGYPLLLADQKWERVKQCILKEHPEAVVEVLDCSHECAWQADMILLYHSDEYKKLLDHIKNVVTGKIVINVVSDLQNKDVQHLLPFSKVVNTLADFSPEVVSYTISGENNQAVEQVLLLFDEIGFKSDKRNT
ncbi:MAG: oxidoreductase [Cytophagaceae bacterium]|jgi:hypothetical protein|nr:oxidoreductase [Cytophagaceae bacterium]